MGSSIDLRWFTIQYQELFFNLVTSKADNATFNKEYAEIQLIKIPEKNYQEKISNILFEIDQLNIDILKLNNNIDNLLNKEITLPPKDLIKFNQLNNNSNQMELL